MDLLIVVAVVVIIGALAMWLINYLGTPQPLAKGLTVAVVVILLLYFLSAIGFKLPNVLGR